MTICVRSCDIVFNQNMFNSILLVSYSDGRFNAVTIVGYNNHVWVLKL